MKFFASFFLYIPCRETLVDNGDTRYGEINVLPKTKFFGSDTRSWFFVGEEYWCVIEWEGRSEADESLLK